MQPAGGIHQEHVAAPGLGRGIGIVGHGGGVGAGALGDHRHGIAFAPDLQLFHGRGAECVCRRQHHALALGS